MDKCNNHVRYAILSVVTEFCCSVGRDGLGIGVSLPTSQEPATFLTTLKMKISPNDAASRLTTQTAVTSDLGFWQSLFAEQRAEVKLLYVRA